MRWAVSDGGPFTGGREMNYHNISIERIQDFLFGIIAVLDSKVGTGEGMGPETTKAVRDMVHDLYLRTYPENHVLQGNIPEAILEMRRDQEAEAPMEKAFAKQVAAELVEHSETGAPLQAKTEH
jgi:hypothetical protein